jgi:GTP:adenosylcobinamide-phosphate guanylyltransferase
MGGIFIVNIILSIYMKLYILCGGSGERLKSYSYPKPLNMIYGKPSLYYSLEHIPSTFKTFHFIYSSHLSEYNFENIVINLFKDRICKFKCIDYFTRGPVESAYLGIKDTICDEEPIMFLDNDNIYRFSDAFDIDSMDTAFIGCNSIYFFSHRSFKICKRRYPFWMSIAVSL